MSTTGRKSIVSIFTPILVGFPVMTIRVLGQAESRHPSQWGWVRSHFYSYTTTGDLFTVDYAGTTPVVTYSYNRLGRHSSITDICGTRNFEYSSTMELLTENLPRWTTQDPSGFPDGANNFVYVNNGVLYALDPSGLAKVLLICNVPTWENDTAEINMRGYFAERQNEMGFDYVLEVNNKTDAKSALLGIHDITDLSIVGHGGANSGQVIGNFRNSDGTIRDDTYLRSTDVASFFDGVDFSNNPNIDLYGCSVADGQTPQDIANATNGTVRAATGDALWSNYNPIYDIFGYGYSLDINFITFE